MHSIKIPVELVCGNLIEHPSDRLVYWVLKCRAEQQGGGKIFSGATNRFIFGLTRQDISEVTHYHVDKISTSLRRLRELKLIRTKRVLGGKLRYEILPHSGVTTTIPMRFILNKKMRPATRVLYVTLKCRAYKSPIISFGMSALCSFTNLSRRTLSRCLLQLKACKLVRVQRRKYDQNLYVVAEEFNGDFPVKTDKGITGKSVSKGRSKSKASKNKSFKRPVKNRISWAPQKNAPKKHAFIDKLRSGQKFEEVDLPGRGLTKVYEGDKVIIVGGKGFIVSK